MTRKEKGDTLEIVIATLERSFINKSDTKIIPNYRNPDSDGIKRDIDIFFETKVNKKLLKYGIECKNFGPNTPIKIEHVTSLHAKIDRTDIKGILVTTGKVQKNAKLKAEKLGIEIYVLVKSQKPIIKKSSFFQQKYETGKFQFLSDKLKDIKKSNRDFVLDFIYSDKDKLKMTVEEYFEKRINAQILQQIDLDRWEIYREFYKVSEEGIKILTGKKVSKVLASECEHTYFKFGNQYFELDKLYLEVKFWVDLNEVENPIGYTYKSLTTNRIFAQFLSYEFEMNGKKFGWNLIIDEDTGEFKTTITDPNKKGFFVDVPELAVFKPGELIIKKEKEKKD